MAHGISSSDVVGSSEGAEWHGLAIPIEKARPLLQYQLIKEPVWNYNPLLPEPTVVPSQFLLTRSDTGAAIPAVVGSDYTPAQWSDRWSLADALCSLIPGASISTAGTVWSGSDCFISISVPAPSTPTPSNDPLRTCLNLIGNNTGRRPELASACFTRIVCNNTLQCALGEDAPTVRIPHFSSLPARLRASRQIAEALFPSLVRTAELIHKFTLHSLTLPAVSTYYDAVLPLPPAPRVTGNAEQDDAAQQTYLRALARVQSIRDSWRNTLLLESAQLHTPPSLWLAYNSVTAYAQHTFKPKATLASQSTADRRFYSNTFGAGAKLSDLAFTSAVATLS
jgi:hypothetical protein